MGDQEPNVKAIDGRVDDETTEVPRSMNMEFGPVGERSSSRVECLNLGWYFMLWTLGLKDQTEDVAELSRLRLKSIAPDNHEEGSKESQQHFAPACKLP